MARGGPRGLDALEEGGDQLGPISGDVEPASERDRRLILLRSRDAPRSHLAAFPTRTAICMTICLTGSLRVRNSLSRIEHFSSSARALKVENDGL